VRLVLLRASQRVRLGGTTGAAPENNQFSYQLFYVHNLVAQSLWAQRSNERHAVILPTGGTPGAARHDTAPKRLPRAAPRVPDRTCAARHDGRCAGARAAGAPDGSPRRDRRASWQTAVPDHDDHRSSLTSRGPARRVATSLPWRAPKTPRDRPPAARGVDASAGRPPRPAQKNATHPSKASKQGKSAGRAPTC